MRNIMLLTMLVFILTSCGQKEQTNKIVYSKKLEVSEDTIQKKEQEKIINNNDIKQLEQNNNLGHINNSEQISSVKGNNTIQKDTAIQQEQTQKILKEETKLIYDTRNSPSAYNFWFTDCKVKFKQEYPLKECQRLSLKEITIGCSDTGNKNGPGKVEINKLFNINKFDLLNKDEVLKGKQSCTEKRKIVKKQEGQRKKMNTLLQKANNEVRNIREKFKLSDCTKYYKQGETIESQIKYIEQSKQIPKELKKNIIETLKQTFVNPVEKCEISFAINIKKDCSILYGTKQVKCKQAQKDIEILKQMELNRENYSIFDINKVKNEIYKKNGLENNLNLPGGGINDRNLPGGFNKSNRPVNFPDNSQIIR